MGVYCKDCKYIERFVNDHNYLCKKKIVKYDYYGNKYYKVCKYKNKDNDCKDFEPKFFKRNKYNFK